MLVLKGRRVEKTIEAVTGSTLLDAAVQNNVDWGFSCTRGTCARCRCRIRQGMNCLSKPNEAEKLRLEPEELEQGYRLGCQTTVEKNGDIVAEHRPYFW